MFPSGAGAGGNKVSHWKEMPTPPNMGGGRGVMGGPLGGPGSLAPNPRMPVNPAGVLKPDGTPWLGGPSRNGVWDGSHDPSAGTPWGHEDKLGNAPWTDSSWGGPNQLNAKKPGQPWMDGAGDVDPSSWGAQPKAGPKPLTKEILWASKQFRILSEMGFKKDDVENALRGANMNLEDALEQLNALRDWPGAKRFDADMGGYGDHPQGTPYRGTPTHNFGAGGPQPPQGANHQQVSYQFSITSSISTLQMPQHFSVV